MVLIILYTFLFSISPFGEARVGIPYGIVSGLHPIVAFAVGLGANLLIYPVMVFLIKMFDRKLWQYRPYKQQSINLIRRAKSGVGATLQKYGFWGLMIFVMIPLPVTGAYMATIAACVFNIRKRKAFAAISIGVAVSCVIMAAGTQLSILGISLF